MHLPRPTTPRLEPIPKVAERAREAMANSFANAAPLAPRDCTSSQSTSLAVGSVSPRKDSRFAFAEYGANTQLMKEEDRLNSLVSFPPFEGESAVVPGGAASVPRRR